MRWVALFSGLHLCSLLHSCHASAFKSTIYNPKVTGAYSCEKYLLHLQQELSYLPESIITFTSFISKIENPEIDSDKSAVISLNMFEPFGDEHITHEQWMHLLYSCTIEMPSPQHLQQMPPRQAGLLSPSDSVLQRVVKLGMPATIKVLRAKGFYDEGHYFHTRDSEGNSLMHLAAKTGSAIIARELAEIMKDNVIDLLQGPYAVNKAGKRPWDIANDALDYHMARELNGLYEIYKIDSNSRDIPKKPPAYGLPEIRVLEKVGDVGPTGGGPLVMPPGWQPGGVREEPRRQKSDIGSQAPLMPGSQVLAADVERDKDAHCCSPSIRRGKGSQTRRLIACLVICALFALVGGGLAYYVVTKKAIVA